ncbi:MAG: efflux RND transporter periplasmic adaptor subunit, partial [Muribaculaceae bacterium]|nr:efflux RND transporter periplasmic adaptor subunit [Muribaculaceae bacterium]
PMTVVGALEIPQAATFEVQGLKYCFVVNDSAKLVQTPITVDPNDDGKNYIITSGLKPGQVVLVEGVGIAARDGMQIKPKK